MRPAFVVKITLNGHNLLPNMRMNFAFGRNLFEDIAFLLHNLRGLKADGMSGDAEPRP
jgi:hypothetical protein